MKRRLMQLLCAVGLLLTLVAIGVFVRGYWASDRVDVSMVHDFSAFPPALDTLVVYGSQRTCVLTWASVRQRVRIPGPTVGDRFRGNYAATRPAPFQLLAPGAEPLWSRLGFGYVSDSFPNQMAWGIQDQYERSVIVPTWFVALFGMAMMCPWVNAAGRTRWRRTAGLCPTCAYDLRGADHARCPECGASVQPPAARA